VIDPPTTEPVPAITGPDLTTAPGLLEYAWGIITNVSEGDWSAQQLGWQDAAFNLREHYHNWLRGQYFAAEAGGS
jgi:FAD synthase